MAAMAAVSCVCVVNTATGEEVAVPAGETQVGRGPFLKVIDRRVSRLHALLKQENGSLSICPKHNCFLKPCGIDQSEPLEKDQWKELCDGDCFSLLPNELEFRVKIEHSTTENKRLESRDDTTPPLSIDPLDALFSFDVPVKTPPKPDPPSETPPNKDPTAPISPPKPDPPSLPDPTCPVSNEEDRELSQNTAKSDHDKMEDEADAATPTLTSSCSGSTGKRRNLPNWLSASGSEAAGPPAKKRKAPTKTAAKKTNAADKSKPKAPTGKKVVKKDSGVSETMASEPSTSVAVPKTRTPEAKDSSPIDSDGATGEDTSVRPKPGAKPKEETAKKKSLPLCPYGTSCYRKNPVHFKEYSHDFSSGSGSPASDDEDKPVCPFGRDCYRRNPAHRKEYVHLDEPARGAGPGKRRSDRKTKGKRSALAGDSDDDGEPNTYDYNDSFIDDQEDSDGGSTSYGDSEDSDWSAGVKEDISELVSDAKDFINDDKMSRKI